MLKDQQQAGHARQFSWSTGIQGSWTWQVPKRQQGRIPVCVWLKKLPEKKLDTVEGQQVDVEQVSKTCSISCDDHFVSGNLKNFSEQWNTITTDNNIMEIIQGYKLEFIHGTEPVQRIPVFPPNFNSVEYEIVDQEIQKLLKMNVIEKISKENSNDGFLSPIFTRPKKSGGYRVILNLRELNKFIVYHHFKMDSFESALHCVTKGCYFASVDFSNAYYSVPLAECHKRFVRFCWDGKVFQYTCLPMGLASAPRIFTKLLKPVLATLRKLGHVIVGYIDDSLIVGHTFRNVKLQLKALFSL